jgi:hypothetical protein
MGEVPLYVAREASIFQDRATARLSGTMYSLIRSGKTTPPQNRQLKILIINSKQQVDNVVGELTF